MGAKERRCPRSLFALGVLAVGLGACGEEVVLTDPPVEFAVRNDSGDAGPSEPVLTLGVFREQFFTPLAAGDDLPIVAGFQDGLWVMPAIRAVAMTGTIEATARVTVLDGEERVGVLDDAVDRLLRTAEGTSEIVGLPIPIRHAPPNERQPIDDLYGRAARLELTLVDAQEQTADASVEVVLVQD